VHLVGFTIETNSNLQVSCLCQRYNFGVQSSAVLPSVASYVLPDVWTEHVTVIIRLKVLESFETS